MHVLSIYDLDAKEARHACTRLRKNLDLPTSPETTQSVVEMIGGRLSYLNKVSQGGRALDII